MNENTPRVKVFLVEDHPAVREGLSHRIFAQPDMVVCGEASQAREALALTELVKPDVAIVDIALKNSDGLEFAKSVKSRNSQVKLIFHSMYDDATYAERCLHLGAKGYVSKQADPEEVVTAIREVMQGNLYISNEMSKRLLSRVGGAKGSDPLEKLTDRQLEIFRLIGAGKGASEISKLLHLSVHTIESHRENIKRKLALNSSPELIRMAVLRAHGRHSNAMA